VSRSPQRAATAMKCSRLSWRAIFSLH
jgi:hypothetical protein